MLKEQFDIAAPETRIRTPELIEAARLLLVEKENAAELAARFGMETSKIYRAAKTIEERWESICEERDEGDASSSSRRNRGIPESVSCQEITRRL
jgi:hypothetical protein